MTIVCQTKCAGRFGEPGWTFRRARADRHRHDRHAFPTGLDQHVGGVAEFRGYRYAPRGLAAHRAKAAYRIGNPDARQTPDSRAAQALKPPLDGMEVRVGPDTTITDDNIGPSFNDRLDKRGNILAYILPISVRIDDDVGPGGKRRSQAALERHRQAPVAAMADDVVDTGRPGNLCRSIDAPIVDDEGLDLVHTADDLG